MKSGRITPTLADWGELRFLRWVRDLAGKSNREIPLSIGDDAAHLRLLHGRDVLVTTDALIENVHFRREWTPPRDLGIKAMASNLSDLAAMGARPVAAFLSLGVPPPTPINQLKAFFRGIHEEGKKFRCPLAGGDMVRAPQWVINIMLVGRPHKEGRIIKRSDAKPGQTLFITGIPGQSGAGLGALRRGWHDESDLIARHNRPTPRIEAAAALAEVCPDLAMIDVSDGLFNDAGHLARESGVRIEILESEFPMDAALAKYAMRTGRFAREFILFGGEDYELLFTSRAPVWEIRAAFLRRKIDCRVNAIGRVKRGAGVAVIGVNGKPLRLADRTFKHFE
ncbi:thiamine-phosphate kinase [Candidatus Sumerlaeota bacterium]|nr:thiamine-phosphate kinase [Candidatus Sumerlaeota bacterium]